MMGSRLFGDAPRPDELPELRFEEAFRTLRANLLLRLPATTKTLMVTGARPREGKSTVAAHLACSLASTGQVALVDADFRRPRQQEVFDLPGHPGFADVLSGGARLEQCLHRVSKSLTVVTSGASPRDPIELLEKDRLEAALEQLRSQFSLVVIDSPPVLAVADAVLIGPRVDAVLLVLRCGEVTVSEARLAGHRLESTGSTLIGCVLNQFPNAQGADYHRYEREYAETALSVSKPSNPAALTRLRSEG